MAFPIFMVVYKPIEIHICDRMPFKFNGQYSDRKNRPAICARNETKKKTTNNTQSLMYVDFIKGMHT